MNNKQLLVYAQYKLLDAFTYVLTIKAKNENNEIVFDGSQKCKFTGSTATLPLDSKEKLVKKNVRNILYHAKRIGLGTKIVTTLTRYGDIPPQMPSPTLVMHRHHGYMTMEDPKAQTAKESLRNQRLWQVILLNGNPTIVRAENPRLSSQEAKELLFKKILGENNG